MCPSSGTLLDTDSLCNTNTILMSAWSPPIGFFWCNDSISKNMSPGDLSYLCILVMFYGEAEMAMFSSPIDSSQLLALFSQTIPMVPIAALAGIAMMVSIRATGLNVGTMGYSMLGSKGCLIVSKGPSTTLQCHWPPSSVRSLQCP